jgi:hypothetical protein
VKENSGGSRFELRQAWLLIILIETFVALLIFSAYFPSKGKCCLRDHHYTCSPPNNFWTNQQILINFSRKVMPLKMISKPWFLILSKMAGDQTSEMYSKFATVNVRPLNFVCWYILKRWITYYEAIFVRSQKYECNGWLKTEVYSIFLWNQITNRCTKQVKSGVGLLKDHGHT